MKDRPHYTLRVIIVDPPSGFQARVEVGRDSFPAQEDEGLLCLIVEYDLRFAGDMGWLPTGSAVKAEKDGRRFVYVAWWRDGVRVRRLKVPLAGVDHFAEEPTIRVAGQDAKGGPACAQARVLGET